MRFLHERESALKLITQRLLNLVDYLLNVIKQKDEQLYAKYRLIDWIEKDGVGYCKIQVVMTSTVSDYTPERIVGSDAFISGFSPIDIRTITNFANHEKYKPRAIVTAINNEDNSIEIKEYTKNMYEEISIEKIQEKLESFSKQDVFNLGRMVGENDTKL